MSRDDIRRFFDEYVFGFIFGDIRREIDLARSGQTAGNFLAALGLLCYTEVMGGIERGTLAPGNGRQNFETFFRRLGPEYESLLETDDAYEMLRCGMAHEYLVKGVAQISMVKGNGTPGVAVDRYGTYHFNVEKYFEDFETVCRELYETLMRRTDPTLPPEIAGRSPRGLALPKVVRDQGFFVPCQEEITVAQARLAAATHASERFAFAALIQNVRQMELSANEVLLERLSQDDPDYDAFINWSGNWITEARADLRELERIKDDALREISREEAEEVLANLEREFSELQDRLRELPDFAAVIERFERHRRNANP